MTSQLRDRVGSEIADGRYRVERRIGDGSMGQVYRAYDRHLETDVVIKFPIDAEGAASPEASAYLERFERESRSLVRLSHPHIVKVIDVGRDDGLPYVVMPFLDGGSLKDRQEAGPLPPGSLHEWLGEIAQALDFVHGQGHIHRDVKPANILFDRHGNAFLGDFGVVKLLGVDDRKGRSDLTAPGFLLGTPNYVAPELVMGQAADGRADQYALALTVHETLTGWNCMEGPTPSATMVNQTQVAPPALGTLVQDVPKGLSDAVLRGLSKDPEDRFESCKSLARAILADVEAPSRAERPDTPPVLYGPDPIPTLSAAPGPTSTPGRRPSRRALLAAGVGGLAAASAAGVLIPRFLAGGGEGDPTRRVVARPPIGEEPVTIHIAYGTEKEKWLGAAIPAFRATEAGRDVTIKLFGMGSVQGADAVLGGPGSRPIHVWSPASSAYRDVFEREWRVRHGASTSPILQAENLVLTPMAFVFWKERHDAFLKKYPRVDFRTLADAMQEPGGWGSIAGRPEWGLFRFAHTHPARSNSGLMTLVLMAYEFADKQRGLTLGDIARPEFQAWFARFERGVTRHGGSLTDSTGTLMKEMVLRGPSQYDCLVLYENLAIDSMKAAEASWGELRVVYPEPNLWNEHPYYILDVPWSDPRQREAAGDFLRFLMSEPIQRQALKYGFRPGNPAVSARSPDAPLAKMERYGLRLEVPRMAEPPRAEVVNDLLSSFRRIEP